ncbi:hypothetical protein KYI13_00255 [Macrococcoides bohemicum]|uniref:hypothetical protein n=1 Tax=Macrococcoides bohemicum TaxID=1903056 RepID=UPI001C5E3E52|nr:hypothetical protein [Macrococcus bohemicus]QYA44813.1 hypothetical protein KYI13_00255 [Macrococcus bohemicus]
MTFYLDKDNKVLFIKTNFKVDINVVQDLAKAIENLEVPYKVIYLGSEDKLIII